MAKYIIMPKLGFNMETGIVAKWIKQEGDFIKEQEVIFEVETDKTVMEVEAQTSGVLRKILVTEGEEVPVTLPIAIIGEKDEDISQMIEEANQKLQKKSIAEFPKEEKTVLPVADKNLDIGFKPDHFKKISPRARKKAGELGINIDLIVSSSPDERISEKDVIIYYQKHQDKVSPIKAESEKKIPYTGMRKIIGDRLSASKFTAPHIYFTVSIDMTQLTDLLKKYNHGSEKRISINDLIIFAVAKVLSEQPAINCSLINEEIVYHKAVHVGVAVALEEGLIVPVVKNANQKSVLQISNEVKELVKFAREGKLMPEDYQGGTITVSNLGMYGIEHFTAIINPPEAAILAVGAIKRMPTVNEEEEKIVIRSMMKVTLSVDHRLVDGSMAVKFLKQVKYYLEFPERFIL